MSKSVVAQSGAKGAYFSYGPIPVKEYLKVYPSTVVHTVEVRNILGRLLQLQSNEGATILFDMTQLPEGMYFLIGKDINGKSLQTARFVITH